MRNLFLEGRGAQLAQEQSIGSSGNRRQPLVFPVSAMVIFAKKPPL